MFHMNLATPLRIRATFDAYSWPEQCTYCGSVNVKSANEFASDKVKCSDCGEVAEPDIAENPLERRGWVDSRNPWGSFEQDSDDMSAEPDEIMLPFAEALEFLRDFPGGVWGTDFESASELCDGWWKSVTAHIDGPEPLVDIILDSLT